MGKYFFVLLLVVAGAGCGKERQTMTSGQDARPDRVVTVRLVGIDGKPGPQIKKTKIVKTEAEWRQLLSPEQYMVTRQKGTEPAFCGKFLAHKEPGIYCCVCCGLPLFSSRTKFESGSGWPSFFQPFAEENISSRLDTSHGMVRTEILCQLCDAHLGHVFSDGPPPTGLRYCLNSAALAFVPAATP